MYAFSQTVFTPAKSSGVTADSRPEVFKASLNASVTPALFSVEIDITFSQKTKYSSISLSLGSTSSTSVLVVLIMDMAEFNSSSEPTIFSVSVKVAFTFSIKPAFKPSVCKLFKDSRTNLYSSNIVISRYSFISPINIHDCCKSKVHSKPTVIVLSSERVNSNVL